MKPQVCPAAVQAECPELIPKDIAPRALEQCGEGVFEAEAEADLVSQLSARFEPWRRLPVRDLAYERKRCGSKARAESKKATGRAASENVPISAARGGSSAGHRPVIDHREPERD
jgi:hypothetical protein